MLDLLTLRYGYRCLLLRQLIWRAGVPVTRGGTLPLPSPDLSTRLAA